MFEELVSNVRGEWVNRDGERPYLKITWQSHREDRCGTFTKEGIGALSLWLKQDHPPSPAQIAARLVERWDRNTDLAEMAWGEKLADLARHIAAVIEAERARESAGG